MGAYDGLQTYFEVPLCDYAIQYGYDDSNIIILEGNNESLQHNYPQIYKNLLSCQHHSDRRTPIQYGQDLVASWIFEDYFLNAMQDAPFDIQLAGTDRSRLILPNQKTSTSSDFIISTTSGKQILMELVNDYKGFWYKNQTLHLRDNKYLQLQQKRCLLLAIALSSQNQKYTIFDFRERIPAKYIANHRPYGFKPAYELQIPNNMLHDFTIENVKQHIYRIL